MYVCDLFSPIKLYPWSRKCLSTNLHVAHIYIILIQNTVSTPVMYETYMIVLNIYSTYLHLFPSDCASHDCAYILSDFHFLT